METNESENLAEIIQVNGKKKKGLRGIFIVIILVAIAAGAGFYWLQKENAKNGIPAYISEPLKKGDISLTITATGNLEPTNEVTIGSELSGTILKVFVETNDRVTKDMPLAQLDTSKLEQQTESSRASLASAEAKVKQAQATLDEAEASLARQQELHRLSSGKTPSKAVMDTAIATAERARADLAVAEASVKEAEAQVKSYESDLAKGVIKSPIDGIVLTRTIEPGQTVAASFQAPELFVIAENLEHMKLKVAVAEADIGRVANGQNASFTVDAWSSRSYTAQVIKVSYGSSITDNVVTYETELEVSNKDLSLRPGMTATADINVAEQKNVFIVPASALRFNPSSTVATQSTQEKSFVQSLMPGPPRRAGDNQTNGDVDRAAAGTARVWTVVNNEPQAVEVKTGLNNGRYVEIYGEGLKEGMPIITRANVAAKK